MSTLVSKFLSTIVLTLLALGKRGGATIMVTRILGSMPLVARMSFSSTALTCCS